MESKYILPPEWAEHSAILLTWPHAGTDWREYLEDICNVYVEMADAITRHERLIIATPEPDKVMGQLKSKLTECQLSKVTLHRCPTNDTWARDHGFITLTGNGQPRLLDFRFNGWGDKFPSELDNAINRSLYEKGIVKGEYVDMNDFVLEGGSIESDGNGTLLTTSKCLLSPNRNGGHSKDEIENTLNRVFGSKKILWLDYGYLEGDDTDSHIDTLARFAPNNNILYVATNNTTDSHYTELLRMKEQLSDFCSAKNEPYKLTELPLPSPIYDDNGNRLPATYANFLIGNGFVLVPTYCQPENDRKAIQAIGGIFKGYTVAGIDCRALIQQHGSLHCVTMQFPKGSINL